MNLRNIVQYLDNKPNATRQTIITAYLDALGVAYRTQRYASGTNIIVDLGSAGKKVGLGSHFDRVATSAGANDNGSAIAVCLAIIGRHVASGSTAGVRVFFFDEEETGLKGSQAYVAEYGTQDLTGLLNMELVGMGDKFALWPVTSAHTGRLLQAFEAAARQQQTSASRFDQIVTNTADHLPFRKAGLPNAFTITCISDQDIATAYHYYKAMEFEVDRQTLLEILAQAPLFEHYHQPTDTYEKISEASLAMTAAVVWETILAVQ